MAPSVLHHEFEEKKTKDQGDRLYPLRLRVGTFLVVLYKKSTLEYPSCDVRGNMQDE
jgi:hypothetical protein